MGLTESEFKIQSERLQSQIREQKIDGYRADLEKEKLVTQAKWVKRDIARENLTTAKVDLQIAQEKTTHSRLKLIGAQLDTRLIEVENGTKTDDLTYQTQAREIGKQMIRARLTALDLNLSEVQGLNADRRTEMKLKGLPTPGNFALPRLGG